MSWANSSRLRRLALEKALAEANDAYAPVVTDWIAEMVGSLERLKAKARDTDNRTTRSLPARLHVVR